MAQREKYDYPGPAASKTYDTRFRGSYPVPHLKTRVPQGIARWSNWDGNTDMLVITAYAPDDSNAYVMGLDATTGTHVGTAKVKASHVGGIAVFADLGWAYISSDHKYRVRKYSLNQLGEAIRNSSYVGQDGADIGLFGASFLAADAEQ